MLCRQATLVGSTPHTLHLTPLKCQCWSCEYCVEHLTRRLQAIAINGEPATLLTLTTNPGFEPDPDLAAARLLEAWQKLSRLYRKRFGKHRWAYLGIWEKTQKGMPHLHILLRAPWVDQREISQFMNDEIQAPIVDIRTVKTPRDVASYVTKYIAKGPAKFAGRTRFARSRNWLDTESARQWQQGRTAVDTWYMQRLPIRELLRGMNQYFEIDGDEDGAVLYPHDRDSHAATYWQLRGNNQPRAG